MNRIGRLLVVMAVMAGCKQADPQAAMDLENCRSRQKAEEYVLEQCTDANTEANHGLEDCRSSLDQCRYLMASCDTDARADERRLMHQEHR